MEIPAIGACMLVEDTEEHREIYGAEREAVLYFDTRSALITKMRWLLEHPDVREQLACAAYERITRGRNTYRHRLETMLDVASSPI
jgi:spore maturation protein CgeB